MPSKSKKFPETIHVTREAPANDKPYLVVQEGGVQSLDVEQDVAVYKLVGVKRLTITKKLSD